MGTGLLTDTGLDIKRLADVQADMDAAFRAAFGQQIKLSPDTELGKLRDILANQLALLWERVEEVYGASYPDGSSGVSLDRIAAITGTFRNPATKSTGTVCCRGASTTIPKSSLIGVPGTQDQFQTVNDLVLPAVHTLADMSTGGHTITRSGTTVTVTYTGHGFTVGGFVWILGAVQPEYNGVHEVATQADADHFTFEIGTTPASPATTVTSITGQEVFAIGVEALVVGPVQALAGTLTDILTPIGGWDAVTSINDADLGALQETDFALRIRRSAALQGMGNATVEAIRGDLLQVPGVTMVQVYENATDGVDGDGRPAHSVECLVRDGDDQDIWDAIFASKSAGIATFGSTSGTVVDSEGFSHTVNFNRLSLVPIYATFNITIGADYPSDGDDRIKAAVIAYGATLDAGQDVVTYPYIIGCASDIPGLSIAAGGVKIGTAPAPGSDANIIITLRQLATFDTANIVVNHI